jgi:exopolysaccharide biosynthesis polyprenyl glycosylphosphotransferase
MLTTQPTGLENRVRPLSEFRTRPRPNSFGASWSLALFAADLLGVIAAVFGAQALTRNDLSALAASPGALQAIIFAAVIFFMVFERLGMYRRSLAANARDEVYATLAASGMALAPMLLLLLLPSLEAFRHTILITLVLAFTGISCARFVLHGVRSHFFPRTSRRIAVVGSVERVASVPHELSLTAADSIFRLPIESFDEEIAEAGGDVASLEWVQVALDSGCDEMIVTEALPAEMMPALLRLTESRGIKLAFAPIRIRPHACDFTVRRDGGLALLYPRSLAICTSGAEAVRRVFDLAIAIPSLIVLSPLFLLVSLAVLIDSGGPIFYRQTRVGRTGKNFEIFKFRTMRPDAERSTGPVWAQTGESRTTRMGRFLRRTSFDELPQLFNVVRGEMSIVGPRPERPFYVEQFRKILPRYDERHLVRPGITGWSHVHMRRNVDTSAIGERLSYDLFYLEHWSIFMDITIIAKTAAEFLFHSAA